VRLLRDTIAQGERDSASTLSGMLANAQLQEEPATDVERLRLLETLSGIPGLPDELPVYARHARKVGRYSFLWSWEGLLTR
jgi:hypothetical protein